MDREQSQTEMPASRLVRIKPFVVAGVSNKHTPADEFQPNQKTINYYVGSHFMLIICGHYHNS